MSAALDITGSKFGGLTVIARNGSNADKKAVWLCRCDCGKEVNKTYKSLQRDKELICGSEHPTKICTSCKKDKPKSDYHICNSNVNGIASKCKECIGAWYEENKEVVKEKYHESKKDEAKRKRRQAINYKSWQKNKHKELPYKRKYNKRPNVIARKKNIHAIRKATDPIYNIKRRLRGRVRDAVKRTYGSGYKYKTSVLLLGCDMDFFMLYLENKFTEGMSWEKVMNGSIHIDHIKPCSKFNLLLMEEQKKCFHYTNLQPMWWQQNLSKGDRYDVNLIEHVGHHATV